MEDPREMLGRANAGDEKAWRDIVRRYQRLVYATIRNFRVDPADAEDIFQESFLRLHTHGTRLRDARALARWLIVTTRRLCLDHLARQKVSAKLAADLDPPSTADAQLDVLVRLERAQEVREALAELPTRCRDVLRLLYLEQDRLEYEAIATQLEMPIGSIGPTRARCLEQLLRRLRASRAREEGT